MNEWEQHTIEVPAGLLAELREADREYTQAYLGGLDAASRARVDAARRRLAELYGELCGALELSMPGLGLALVIAREDLMASVEMGEAADAAERDAS
ncbi:hypothetical protein [Saccharopolyspora cebuensis]|uniref:Transcriptional regulator n=1 Tax=Saccharopolyspora cebuensis TaxID=418759 RepID=A0ABV4CKQ4_9PSEU